MKSKSVVTKRYFCLGWVEPGTDDCHTCGKRTTVKLSRVDHSDNPAPVVHPLEEPMLPDWFSTNQCSECCQKELESIKKAEQDASQCQL